MGILGRGRRGVTLGAIGGTRASDVRQLCRPRLPNALREPRNWLRLCVQRRLVCSAGIKPAGAKVRRPVALDGMVEGNRDSEAHRQGLPWGDCKSPGRNDTRSGLENK